MWMHEFYLLVCSNSRHAIIINHISMMLKKDIYKDFYGDLSNKMQQIIIIIIIIIKSE